MEHDELDAQEVLALLPKKIATVKAVVTELALDLSVLDEVGGGAPAQLSELRSQLELHRKLLTAYEQRQKAATDAVNGRK